MKFKALLLSIVLAVALLAGCGADDTKETSEPQTEETNEEATNEEENNEEETDATTTASIVDDEDAFKEAISADGTWIIATLDDLSFDEELVLEGEFYDKDDESSDLYRKIGLYEQDEERNVTARYSLTAPKLTIKSPNAKIQSGTFVGDIYVEAEGFKLVDTKVEGNVYFASEEYKESFEQDEKSEVTGEVAVQE
ncbi:hypothetical protein GOQ27_13620 [Clostridium sp. D2Q-11]|uniref:Lipoprotein n=1 Tax=Anaeromonas frigoriresistens TaxID=2683708 RepID=A0A942UZ73_9FIRM|nr:hypothetical protein [Anaeromonas frigoriresistens]